METPGANQNEGPRRYGRRLEQGLAPGWLDKALNLAERAGLRHHEPTCKRLRRAARARDPVAAAALEEWLWKRAVPHIVEGNPFYPPPTPEQLAGHGGFPFGQCALSGHPHHFDINRERGNIVVSGTLGCAKTTLFCHFALGAAGAGLSVHVDIPRADCRFLAKYHGFRLALPSTYRMNILAPIPNVPLNVLIQTLAESFAHNYDLRTRGKLTVGRWLRELFEVFRPSGRIPCLADLVESLRAQRFDAGSYERECSLRVIERVESCIAYSGDILLCERGQPFEEITDPVVFDMSGVESQVRDFLCELRIRRQLLFRQYNPGARDVALYELLDEGVNLARERKFSSSSREMGVAPLDQAAVNARYLGVHLGVATQVVSTLSSAIEATATIKTAGTTLAGQVGHTAKMLGLNRDQADFLPKLARGTFVVRDATPELPDPFLLQFQRLRRLDERIDEGEGQAISEESLADLPWTPRRIGYEQALELSQQEADETKKERAHDVADRVFRRIAEHPDETCRERAQALGIERATESKARRDLGPQGRGLVAVDGHVGNRAFFKLTDRGRKTAKSHGCRPWKDHASAAHAWVVKQCRRGLGQAGALRTLRRSAVNGREPDALYNVEGVCVAIQVCGSENYRREAHAVLELADAPGVDLVVAVGTHRRHAEGVRRALEHVLGDVGWERIQVLDAAQILRDFDWRSIIGTGGS